MTFIKKILFFIFLINVCISQTNSSKSYFNDFGFSLFRKINSNNDVDFLISPISVGYALMMTNSGASNKTSDEILTTLDISILDIKKINKDLYLYIQSSKDNNLIFGNSIWIQNDKCYMPNQDYVVHIQSTFKGQVSFVNFYDNRLLIIDSINTWVNNKTNGLIENIVSNQDIKATTKQVLLNTLYFKSNWRFPFDISKTKMENFFFNEKIFSIPMMKNKNRYFHHHGEEFHLLDIPYNKNDISMLLMLPNKNNNLEKLIQKLDFSMLNKYLDSSEFEMGDIWIPKFELEFSVSLKDYLKDMGMKIPFDPQLASFDKFWDYTGTCKKNPPKHYIDIVNHKVNININETGTEVAAATAVVINRITSINPSLKPFEFKANKPFLYAIYDKKNETILFLGKYTGYKQ